VKPKINSPSPAQRQLRHEVVFDTARLDWNPDQVLRVAAGILWKHGVWRDAIKHSGLLPEA